MEKILLLDIDKTIIDTDSMMQFVFWSMRKKPLNIIRFPWVILATILFQLGLMPIERTKSVVYKPINSMSKAEINDFMDNHIMKYHKNDILFDIIDKYRSLDYKVVMITASIETYMVYFKEQGYADILIGTQYDNKVIGKNCKSEEKVKRLAVHNIDIDYDNSYAYSDSLTDLPMLNLVKNKFQVKYKNGKAYLKQL